jgi:hypothetical protein
MKRLSFALALCLVFLANAAFAQASFQFAVPNFRAPNDPEVNGLRLSIIHGENQSQRGLDMGLLSMSETSRLSGLALIAGISKVNEAMSGGVAFSLVNWHSGTDSGVNGAFINILNEAGGAFNTGFVIIAQGATMVDLGGFNMSRKSTAQIGFVNVTDEITGFQFGFLNIAKNGFLPIFPVVNFSTGSGN